MDRLEQQLRTTLADDRLTLPVRPDAARRVLAGVRRRRRNRAIATVTSAVVLLGGGVAAASLANRGGNNERIVPPTGGSRPSGQKPAATVDEVPWADTSYDYKRPPLFPGTAADPSVPWCRAAQLSLTDRTQAADLQLLVDNTVTNVSATTCALQGQPAATIRAGSKVLLSSVPETFYVNEWVRLAPQKEAHVQVNWGDQYCGKAAPTSIALSLPHSGGTLSATLTRSPGCNSTNLSDNGQLDVGGFVTTTGAPFTPLAGLQASIDHVSATTMPGGTVTYRLRLQSRAAQQVALTPCLPFRERLVNSSTGRVIEEEHLLNCADAPSSIADAHSSRLTYFDLRIAVPPTAPPGSYALLWQSVLKPVNAFPDTDVRIGTTAPCQDGQLVATAGVSGAATGHYVQVIVLRNVGAAACTLRGYPGIQLLSKDGRVMSPAPKRGSDFMFQDPGPQTVTLAGSGGTASFSVGGSDYDAVNQRACPAATQIGVYAPETRVRLLVPVGFPVCSTGVDFSAVVAGGQGVR